MHELSIATSLVDMASEEASLRGCSRVYALHLKVGPLSGVVKEALLFSYDIACSGTPLEGSKLIVEETSVVIYCAECKGEKAVRSIHHLLCPDCGRFTFEIVRGRELEFVAMEIEEAQPEPVSRAAN